MPKTKSKKLTWEEKISKQLVGRKIVQVRWMTKEEARWLDDKWNDFYYYFQVEDMFEKDQEIFKNIGKKLSEQN